MVAIYVRQSLDKKDSLSIDAQIEDCITLCKRNGWNEYKVYRDKGWSAKNLDRPSFQQMNEDVLNGKIEAVVCYKIDRISRSIRDLVNLIEDYSELGVHFVSYSDNINTAVPGGMMLATLFGSLAQMEREAIIARVTDNYYYRCEQGFWGGGPAPYGYRLKKVVVNGQRHTVLEQNPTEAAVVRQFFDWYLEPGMTIYQILQKADEQNIVTRKGKPWTSRVVSSILSRPVYAPNTMDIYNFYASQGVKLRIAPEQCDGTLSVNLYGKRDRGSKHPKRSRPASEMIFSIARHQPIIDSDQFLKVQLKKKTTLATTPRTGTSRITILSGLVRCGDCGRAMSPSGSNRGVRYFICSGRRNYASSACNSPSIKMDALEDIVLAHTLQHYSLPEIIQVLDKFKNYTLSPQESVRVNTLKQELAKTENEISSLIDACLVSNPTAISYLNDRIEKLDQEKKKIIEKITTLKNSKSDLQELLRNIDIENLPEIFAGDDFDLKKYVCHQLIRKITFYNQEHIKIEYTV